MAETGSLLTGDTALIYIPNVSQQLAELKARLDMCVYRIQELEEDLDFANERLSKLDPPK